MAMSKTDFKNAFREAVSSEFAHIPTDENSIDFTFSERFNKRMAKLIKSQKKVYYNFINTAYKRVAIICIVLLTMLTTACSVKAIREPIVNFFTEVYESFTRYFFEGETADTIIKEYSLNVLPDGFEQTNKIQNDISITTVLENKSGDIIEISQTITDNTQHNLDNQNGVKYEITVDGQKIQVLESDSFIQSVWIKDKYCFKVTGYGNIDKDTLKQVIENIK